MGAVHELRIRSNKFVSEIQAHIEAIVDDNQYLIDLNQEQLKQEHATTDDKPITPPYSRSYAAKKGFKTPDLYYSGDMFGSMTIEATKDNSYHIKGNTDYTPKLIGQYTEKIFGIAKSKQKRAKSITTKLLSESYKAAVFTR